MKAILLARVSSEEQELGNSIPAQVHKMQEYAEHKGLQILEVQEITESSSIDTRKKFDLIIKTIQASKEPIALVQRSFKESIILGDLLKAGKLQIHFIRENLILHKDSNSSDLIRWDMGVMFARSYVLQLSDNVKRGNEQKIRSGEWTGKAPIGYLNIPLENEKHTIVLDPERGPYIRKVYYCGYVRQKSEGIQSSAGRSSTFYARPQQGRPELSRYSFSRTRPCKESCRYF